MILYSDKLDFALNRSRWSSHSLNFVEKAWQSLSVFLQSTQYKNSLNSRVCVFNYAFDIKEFIFAVMTQQSKILNQFNNYMIEQRKDRVNWLDFYSVKRKLRESFVKNTDAILLVNVDDAQEHELLEIKRRFSQLSERLILQDVSKIIEKIKIEQAFEIMIHDFFSSQTVIDEIFIIAFYTKTNRRSDARVYYFRNVFHDWSDKECLEILKNVTSTMKKNYSSILINEWCFSDDTSFAFAALSNINMMIVCADMKRTEMKWRKLLSDANLHIDKIWISFSNVESFIEASLKWIMLRFSNEINDFICTF